LVVCSLSSEEGVGEGGGGGEGRREGRREKGEGKGEGGRVKGEGRGREGKGGAKKKLTSFVLSNLIQNLVIPPALALLVVPPQNFFRNFFVQDRTFLDRYDLVRFTLCKAVSGKSDLK
jgi:hypothetical protein